MLISNILHLLVAAGLSNNDYARGIQPIEPVEIPASVQQGVDMIYIDPEIAPAIQERDALLSRITATGAANDLFVPGSMFYTDLRRALVRYRMSWGGLPSIQIPEGPLLKVGGKGERVALLRQRLGLSEGDMFDQKVTDRVRAYQEAHGLKPDGAVGAGTLASLNRGADHYERILRLNLDRAKRLPGSDAPGRNIIVDTGAARIYLVEDGVIRDSMKAIVGKAASPTPMMAALIRYASVNPYWNVPPDLAQTLIAPRVLAEGVSYLKKHRYEVLSDWTDEAHVIDPATVDWKAVADGMLEPRVRELPGPGNSMGDIKFMMPNDFGIYLHDTPDRALFNSTDRWLSNGCVRVEDAKRLAKWLFGDVPKGKDRKVEEDVELTQPVPVFITHLTAGVENGTVRFRRDAYGRDQELLSRYEPAAEQEAG